MSARKLGRFAGLVLALAVVFGGVAGLSGHPSAVGSGAVQTTNNVIDWE
ncbi:hypothetical protein SAMN05421748_112209 [Paractinoplanes atraurantiacus]|uniref:Uncharacterized protein n=1 Tax=Paractinoplanes atraurantiacus TaxID=1036182 RepID=A0A285IYN3_9ACTN|nr:hypothetical protein SAMN05421748_112209 [Actinoplanes atraurantiacus]